MTPVTGVMSFAGDPGVSDKVDEPTDEADECGV